jgi:putative PIN family toxin of toxin-antitoxin system
MLVRYDTNELVRTLSRREGIPAFKRDTVERHITNITSQHILSEVEAVLAERMKLTKQKAKAATRLLERQSIVVNPRVIEKVCRDPFDDYVLAAAVEGGVEYLVTEDKDLLVLKNYKNVKVVNMSTFRNIIDKQPQSIIAL